MWSISRVNWQPTKCVSICWRSSTGNALTVALHETRLEIDHVQARSSWKYCKPIHKQDGYTYA